MMMAKTVVMRPYSMLSALRSPLLFRRCVSYLQTTTRPSLLISDKPPCSVVGLINRSKMDHGQRRSFSVGANYVNEPGSIDSPLMQSMEKKIKEQLKADVVVVKDTSGDGRHVSIDVISSAFEGQSAVNRQRMVYKAIWEELQSIVHAVDQMTTRTPSEAA